MELTLKESLKSYVKMTHIYLALGQVKIALLIVLSTKDKIPSL